VCVLLSRQDQDRGYVPHSHRTGDHHPSVRLSFSISRRVYLNEHSRSDINPPRMRPTSPIVPKITRTRRTQGCFEHPSASAPLTGKSKLHLTSTMGSVSIQMPPCPPEVPEAQGAPSARPPCNLCTKGGVRRGIRHWKTGIRHDSISGPRITRGFHTASHLTTAAECCSLVVRCRSPLSG